MGQHNSIKWGDSWKSDSPILFLVKPINWKKNGLICERIFRPIKSGIRTCGNYQVIRAEKEGPKFCEECVVEFVDFGIRRYQM